MLRSWGVAFRTIILVLVAQFVLVQGNQQPLRPATGREEIGNFPAVLLQKSYSLVSSLLPQRMVPWAKHQYRGVNVEDSYAEG